MKQFNCTKHISIFRGTESVCLRNRRLLHEVEEIGGGLNGLRDLIGYHGFGRTFSAAPTACWACHYCLFTLQNFLQESCALFRKTSRLFEECSYLFFFFGLGIEVFGGKNRNLEFIFHNKEINLVIFFFFLLSISTVLTSKNIFISYNFITWFIFSSNAKYFTRKINANC